MTQLELDIITAKQEIDSLLPFSYPDRLAALLASDLDFHGRNSAYASHNYHAFPAKFPPQLPRLFIENLTLPGDVVLDPMVGSGTTVVEAFLTGRHGVGIDLDPLALRLGRVKTTPIHIEATAEAGFAVLRKAQELCQKQIDELQKQLDQRFESTERAFIDYWFLPATQCELLALLSQIEIVEDTEIRAFLELVFSAIIITKSGGVSLARDLAHTRPHRVLDKQPRSALVEFSKRLKKNLESATELSFDLSAPDFMHGNAMALPLQDDTVDLIVTSPPYASNAIDYMRAHKFSLVWFGRKLQQLSDLRGKYIGHDATQGFDLLTLPPSVQVIVDAVAQTDGKKAQTLHRYYSEATCFLTEMLRVLKPGRAAIVVVGSSIMRGIDTQTGHCLAEIGKNIGFADATIAIRHLDRDKRMMPARSKGKAATSLIEARMHEEYILAFLKNER
ncbi:MAG: DNA methyltransferase [Anaerolineae bacterium]|jgi:DNA modification methylase|nr:DNA methyltransferase [Anaerolineae bacterium]